MLHSQRPKGKNTFDECEEYTMKKIICMALALIMLLALGCTAFAAEEKNELDAIKEAVDYITQTIASLK